MWRRIQTLYLGLATVLVASLFFMKFATVCAADGEAVIYYYELLPTALLIFSALSASGVAAFSYKNRPLQIRLAMTSALVNVALQAYLLYHFFRADDSMVFSVSVVFPAVAAVLDILAVRAIGSDEVAVSTALKMKKINAKLRRKEKKARSASGR